MSDTDVLIAGAGPTGLFLALWLRRYGVRVRIIDKNRGPGETSRALAVQARTLEYERQIGIVDDVLAAGVRVDNLCIRTPRGIAATLNFGAFGRGISAYPFAFALAQDVHEQILTDHLSASGVEVERETTLVSFTQTEGSVSAILEHNGQRELVKAAYLAGCDGSHSTVRHALGIAFPGGTYAQSFYVADVEGSGPVTHEGMTVRPSYYGFAIVMPVRQTGTLRLIGVVPKAFEATEDPTFDLMRRDIERDTGITVTSVKWFSTYRVHHRVAEHFRTGRVFLAGDAGHIHSPAGGQGMNTGMSDAANLAWKLAAVLQGRADAWLLESYEPERLAFAHKLIATTDRMFRVATNPSRAVGLFRRYVLPRLMRLMMASRTGARAFFRLMSQTSIEYRASPISAGRAGILWGGDRLPFVQAGQTDNHAALGSLDWQVHVYGEAGEMFAAAVRRAGLVLHCFPWSDAMARAGLSRNAAYLVRPDGHIGLILPDQSTAVFERYLADWWIRPRSTGAEEPLETVCIAG